MRIILRKKKYTSCMFYTVCFKNASQEVFGSTSIMIYSSISRFLIDIMSHLLGKLRAQRFRSHQGTPSLPTDLDDQRCVLVATIPTLQEHCNLPTFQQPFTKKLGETSPECPCVLQCVVVSLGVQCFRVLCPTIFFLCLLHKSEGVSLTYQTNIRQMSSFKNPQDFPLNSQVSSFAATFAPHSRPALWLS